MEGRFRNPKFASGQAGFVNSMPHQGSKSSTLKLGGAGGGRKQSTRSRATATATATATAAARKTFLRFFVSFVRLFVFFSSFVLTVFNVDVKKVLTSTFKKKYVDEKLLNSTEKTYFNSFPLLNRANKSEAA